MLLYETSRHGILGKQCELQVEFIVQRLGLSDFIDLEWSQLSGGYKLRFELAKALVWKPSFLVLDEPLANLDASAQLTILNDLRNLAHRFRNPICVLITSQHIHEIEHVADKLLVLDSGNIIYTGLPLHFRIENVLKIAELSCNADLDQLRAALQQYEISIEDRGFCFLLHMPEHQNSGAILHELQQKNIQVTYFRDISHSVKQIFYANN